MGAQVCDYAKAYALPFPSSLYCSGKYSDPLKVHECQGDPRCEPSIDTAAVCTASGSEFRLAATQARQVIPSAFGHDVA